MIYLTRVISNATVSNAAPTWGENISVTWTITNRGPSKAIGQWYDGFYLSNNATLDSSDVSVGSRWMADVSPLASGGSYTVSQSFTLPSTSKDLRYLLAVTDSSNYQREKNEGNNVKVIALLIDRPPQLPPMPRGKPV